MRGEFPAARNTLWSTTSSSDVLHSDIRHKIWHARARSKMHSKIRHLCWENAHFAESIIISKNYVVEERWDVVHSKRFLISSWLRRRLRRQQDRQLPPIAPLRCLSTPFRLECLHHQFCVAEKTRRYA